jgi:anti-sigma factor (TIGR02949 family)
MTSCDTTLDLLSTYVDGEIAPAEELELRRHLDVCESCRSRVETLLALKEAVAATAETRPVPYTLRERLATLSEPWTGRFLDRRVWRAGLAAGGLLVIGAAGWFMLRPQVHADIVTEALIADHVHFLQVPDAFEITSNDPRQIAAWFSNKVAFPVHLPDLQGADLLGARLCSLWNHKIALAFYAAHGKRLSFFVVDPDSFPPGYQPARGCRTALKDYHVCIIPTSSTVLALVGDKDETAAILSELEALATKHPMS